VEISVASQFHSCEDLTIIPNVNLILATGASAESGDIAVVADILRASTTITRALELGAAAVIPVLTPCEARALAAPRGALLMGERGSVKIPGFDLGNSPSELTAARVRGREIVFTSTNFPRTLAASAAASEVYVGCFLNLSAVAETAVTAALRSELNLCIVLAGDLEHESAEDLAFAGALSEALQSRGCTLRPSAQQAATRARLKGAATLVRGAIHADTLRRLGFDADVEMACRVDTCGAVGLLRGGSITLHEPSAH
jgi:2-phosphosulfolactate phosphatase